MLAYATAGNVVVGVGAVEGRPLAFRWTPSTGLVGFLLFPEAPRASRSTSMAI